MFLVLPLVSHSQSIYTCTVDGVTVYSQSPCGNEDKEVTVHTPPMVDSGSHVVSSSKQSVDSKTPQQYFDEINTSQYGRKIRKLELKIESYQRRLDAKLEALKIKKLYAKNNTAGAIYEDSISNEMIAITNQYNIKINQERERIASLKQKISKLSTK